MPGRSYALAVTMANMRNLTMRLCSQAMPATRRSRRASTSSSLCQAPCRSMCARSCWRRRKTYPQRRAWSRTSTGAGRGEPSSKCCATLAGSVGAFAACTRQQHVRQAYMLQACLMTMLNLGPRGAAARTIAQQFTLHCCAAVSVLYRLDQRKPAISTSRLARTTVR